MSFMVETGAMKSVSGWINKSRCGRDVNLFLLIQCAFGKDCLGGWKAIVWAETWSWV